MRYLKHCITAVVLLVALDAGALDLNLYALQQGGLNGLDHPALQAIDIRSGSAAEIAQGGEFVGLGVRGLALARTGRLAYVAQGARIVEVNLDTGHQRVIVDIADSQNRPEIRFGAIAVSPTTGDLFVLDLAPEPLGGLLRVDPTSGSISRVFQFAERGSALRDIAAGKDGFLYIVVNGSTDRLWRLHENGGPIVTIVSEGPDAFFGGIAVGPNLRVYLSGSLSRSGPSTIWDVTTGVRVEVASEGLLTGGRLAVAPDGRIYATATIYDPVSFPGINTAIVEVDPRDGSQAYFARDLNFAHLAFSAGAFACADGVDNDGDGLTDVEADPGCDDGFDDSERGDQLPCDNGVDDDEDGKADYPADLGCDGPEDPSERTPQFACDDNLDNDSDGFSDYPSDPGCSAADDVSENGPGLICDNGIDDDDDGLIDLADPICFHPSAPRERALCQDQVDNDGDGAIDLADPDCIDANTDSEGAPACSNGVDDDNDGLVDGDDPGCSGPDDPSELSNLLACDDGFDNDRDTLVDTADPGCEGPTDPSERSAALVCDNGRDDDEDGLTDYPTDPGCSGPDDESEYSFEECDNGLDDDLDGLVDRLDPDCRGGFEWPVPEPGALASAGVALVSLLLVRRVRASQSG